MIVEFCGTKIRVENKMKLDFYCATSFDVLAGKKVCL